MSICFPADCTASAVAEGEATESTRFWRHFICTRCLRGDADGVHENAKAFLQPTEASEANFVPTNRTTSNQLMAKCLTTTGKSNNHLYPPLSPAASVLKSICLILVFSFSPPFLIFPFLSTFFFNSYTLTESNEGSEPIITEYSSDSESANVPTSTEQQQANHQHQNNKNIISNNHQSNIRPNMRGADKISEMYSRQVCSALLTHTLSLLYH